MWFRNELHSLAEVSLYRRVLGAEALNTTDPVVYTAMSCLRRMSRAWKKAQMTHGESSRRSADEITQVWVGAVRKFQLLALVWYGACPCLFISAGRISAERQMSGTGCVAFWRCLKAFLSSVVQKPLSFYVLSRTEKFWICKMIF